MELHIIVAETMPFEDLAPGTAPGTVLVRIYGPDAETVLREYQLDDDDAQAEAAQAFIRQLLDDDYNSIWLVGYDGDTGKVMGALQQSVVANPSMN